MVCFLQRTGRYMVPYKLAGIAFQWRAERRLQQRKRKPIQLQLENDLGEAP
jgi:hypothetical protein